MIMCLWGKRRRERGEESRGEERRGEDKGTIRLFLFSHICFLFSVDKLILVSGTVDADHLASDLLQV